MSKIDHWLSELGLEKYIPAFLEAEIEIGDLPSLSEEDLKELGLPMGPRRRVNEAIKLLGGDSGLPALGASDGPSIIPAQSAVPGSNAPASAVSLDAERRHLTVMFVDLVGSTDMATKIDPEDMREVITHYQNTVAGVVGRFDGFVAKFMGDGVLCYFGWPRANEDDAERAVRAGLSIIDSVRKTKSSSGQPIAAQNIDHGIYIGLIDDMAAIR
jgi:hypothetical protein